MSRRRGRDAWLRRVAVGAPLLWMGLFFLAPLAVVVAVSLGDARLGQPPVAWTAEAQGGWTVDLDSFRRLVDNPLYGEAFLGSLRMAGLTTALALLIGYPMALGIARAGPAWRATLLVLVVLPFWTSFLLRVYAWMGLLGLHGPVNAVLLGLGLAEAPSRLLNSDGAMLAGLVYTYLPFMVLPLYATLARMDPALAEAAADLGARPAEVLRDVVLPLSLRGVAAGSLLVFAPVMGEYVVPSLLGRADSPMLGRVLADEFFLNRDWPVTAALALVILATVAAPLLLLDRLLSRGAEAR